MSSTAVANARLLRVQGEGGDPYGTGNVEGAGSEKWVGWVGCFYDEAVRRRNSEKVIERTVEISSDLRLAAAPHELVEVEVGDWLTFHRDGASEPETGKVSAVEGDPSRRGELGTVRLTLEG